MTHPRSQSELVRATLRVVRAKLGEILDAFEVSDLSPERLGGFWCQVTFVDTELNCLLDLLSDLPPAGSTLE